MFWKIQILFAHLTWAVFWTKYLIFMFRTNKQERLFKFTIARDSTKLFCAALSQFVKPPPRMRKNGCANPGHNRPKLLKQVVNAFFLLIAKPEVWGSLVFGNYHIYTEILTVYMYILWQNIWSELNGHLTLKVQHPLWHGDSVWNGHPWHSHLRPSVWKWRLHVFMLKLRFEHPTFHMRCEHFNHCYTAAFAYGLYKSIYLI